MTEDNRPRGVPLSPKSMVDSVADWNLHRVVEHLRQKEKDGNAESGDVRVYCRSSIRMLNTVIGRLHKSFGVSRGRMCRCLTYHGLAIMKDDSIVRSLDKTYVEAQNLSLSKDDPSISDIINHLVPYAPVDSDTEKTSYRVYDSWMLSEVEDISQVCGVYPGQYIQMAMLRSILTHDDPNIVSVAPRLVKESHHWDIWMSFRLAVLEVAVAKWESLL